MIPYDYEQALKLRVIKAMLGIGDETAKELWLETIKMLEAELSDRPRLTKKEKDDED